MSNIDSNKQIDEYQLGQNHVIESMWLKFSNNSQGSWITKVPECIKLHEYLAKLQPKHILELGTGIGCSTEIMAFSCPNTSIYTIEQNPKCIAIAKTLIAERLQQQIYFRHAKVAALKPIYEVSPFVHFLAYHTPFDWRNYDFIFVDGPGPIMAKMKNPDNGEVWEVLAELPGADVILLLPRMNEGTIVYIDKRKQMVMLYKRHLAHYLELVDDARGYTIFRRNAKPLKLDLSDFQNSDSTYMDLKSNGYFEEVPQEQNI